MRRNLVVFDLETTGLDKQKDSIIQFAAIKIDMNTNKMIDSKNLYIRPIGNYTISIQAYFKHGIKPEFLEDKPTFPEVADEILAFFEGCDILTYNGCHFDNSFLQAECERCGKRFSSLDYDCYDAFLEEKRRNGNSLGETFKRYIGKTMEEYGLQAHDALSDVKATYAIFNKQMKIAPVEPEKLLCDDNFVKLMEFNGELQPCFSFGKYKDLSLSYVSSFDQNYLKWCVSDKAKIAETSKKFVSKYIK